MQLASVLPCLTPFSLLAWQPTRVQRAPLAPALLRMIDGLHALPPISPIFPQHICPGPWCAAAPLFSNPLLPPTSEGSLIEMFTDVAATPIDTVAALQRAATALCCPNPQSRELHFPPVSLTHSYAPGRAWCHSEAWSPHTQ